MGSSFLLAFDSTHCALAAQQALEHLKPRLIPIPRSITAGCGMALRFEADDDLKARAIFATLRDQDIQSHLYLIAEESASYRLLEE